MLQRSIKLCSDDWLTWVDLVAALHVALWDLGEQCLKPVHWLKPFIAVHQPGRTGQGLLFDRVCRVARVAQHAGPVFIKRFGQD